MNITSNKDSKGRYFKLVLFGLSTRVIFSFFGHNYDWPVIFKHMKLTSEMIDIYSIEKFFPYFPTRFLIEIPIYNFINFFDFSNVKFIVFGRVFYILIFYLIQSTILFVLQNYLSDELVSYFHTSLTMAFISGFMNQLDSFVIIVCSSLLIASFKENNNIKQFGLGFFFFLFASFKPYLLPFLFFLLFNKDIYKLKNFYLGNVFCLSICYLIFFNFETFFPKYDLFVVLEKIVSYKGFSNLPLINLLNLNFDFKIQYLKYGFILTPKNLLLISFLILIIKKLYLERAQNFQYFFYIYLIYYWIFSPTLAQQNLAILLVAINLFDLPKIKLNLKILDIFIAFYLLFLNLFFVTYGSMTNTEYLIFKIYNFLNYYGLLFIPLEKYFGNFVFLAILFHVFFDKKIKRITL